jgi:protein-L-isoaspartate(D-aspartate) O-methyltransferase
VFLRELVTMNFETARAQMLGQQVRAWEVLDYRVLSAMRVTPRELFVPESDRELAFADVEIPLGHGQFMMAPKIEGRLLQALQIEPIDEVLEIGTGSGYLTACLARLAQRVTSVDIFPDFVSSAAPRLAKLGIGNVEVAAADGLALSYSKRFDAIAVTGSTPTLTTHFINMLKPRGRLFIVVGRAPVMEACLVTLHPRGHWTRQDLFETVLTPLVNAEQPEPFVL